MTAFAILRMVGSLALVLAILLLALWLGRRKGLRSASGRRLAIVERLGIDAKRSLVLVRWDAGEHLLLLAPEGQTLVASRSDPDGMATAESSGTFASAVDAATACDDSKIHLDTITATSVASPPTPRARSPHSAAE